MSDVKQDSIELVLSDMDGTLLSPDHSLSPRNLAAVKKLQAAGVHFTLASGRPPRAMREISQQLGIELPVAGFNGGLLVNAQGEYLQSHHVHYEGVLKTLALLAEHPVEVWLFVDEDWLVRDPSGEMVAHEQHGLGYAPKVVESYEPYLHKVHKIVATCSDAPLLLDLEQRLQPVLSGLAVASRSQARYLDITALKANKGDALVALAEFLDVPLVRTAAIGDGGNDPAMFHRAGISIAMGQAPEEIRKQAMYVTGSNLEDGVAQAIERFIL